MSGYCSKGLQSRQTEDFLQELLGVSVDVIRLSPRLDPFLVTEIQRDGICIVTG